MTTDDHAWLTVPEAARELRVSVPTVWRWIRAGRLTASRIGSRSVRVQRRELALIVRPVSRRPGGGKGVEVGTDKFAPYIRLGDPNISSDELLARLTRHRQAILDRRGGIPLPDSAPLIRQIREEHGDDL
jgi:excisionase family DNA binding protein